MTRQEILLAVYAAERAYNAAQLQILVALVTGGITYIVAVSGLVVSKCAVRGVTSPSLTLHLGGTGCQAVPHVVLWAAPLPILGLLGFLTLTQTVLDFGGAHIAAIERELAKLSQSQHGELVVPQGFDHVLHGAYRRPPSVFAPVIAYLSVSAIVVGFLVLMLRLMPWSGPGKDTTHVVASVYIGGYILLGLAFVATTLRITPIYGWKLKYEPERVGGQPGK